MPDPDYAPKIVRLVGSPRPRRVPGLGSRILAIYWVAMVVWLVITRSFSWLFLIVGVAMVKVGEQLMRARKDVTSGTSRPSPTLIRSVEDVPSQGRQQA